VLKWGKNMRYYKRSYVHYSKSAMKIIALVFMLVGVTFLAVGIGFAIHQTQLKNRCTLEVNAIISDILSKDERHENDDGHVSAQFTHQCIHITLTDSSTPLTAILIPATSDTEEDKRSRYSVTLTTLKRFMHQMIQPIPY
jgi:hypothetical protein